MLFLFKVDIVIYVKSTNLHQEWVSFNIPKCPVSYTCKEVYYPLDYLQNNNKKKIDTGFDSFPSDRCVYQPLKVSNCPKYKLNRKLKLVYINHLCCTSKSSPLKSCNMNLISNVKGFTEQMNVKLLFIRIWLKKSIFFLLFEYIYANKKFYWWLILANPLKCGICYMWLKNNFNIPFFFFSTIGTI